MDPDAPFGPRFAVRRRLGEGGFGVVYEALDRERGHPVAIKSLRRLDPSALYQFKQEFRSLVDLAHPNLITLYELFSQGERWFFTMELVEGQDALAWVRRRPPSAESPTLDQQRALATTRVAPRASLPDAQPPSPSGAQRRWPGDCDEERLRSVLAQLAGGLCCLHDVGKLHRDIKPSNMLVTPEGRLVLLDFGLVRSVGANSGLSQDTVAGTPGYMSPEQGRSGPIGPASDWYSVGAFLFEALTGRLPFEGAWLKVLAQQQRHRAPPPGQFVAGLPADLEALAQDLLATAPEARPTGREVLLRLGRRRGAPSGPQTPPSGPIGLQPRGLVGRAAELTALREAEGQARQGRGTTVLVVGGPGVGKSALLRHLGELLEGVVLSGRCFQQEAVPYKALDGIVDALSRYLRRLPRHEAQALLPQETPALARLFPVLEQVEALRQAPRPPQDVADQQELRRRAFDALREMLGRLADRRPLALLIDDLHWGDEDSAALLAHLLAPPAAPALLLVASCRAEETEASPCVAALRRALPPAAPGGELQELPLGPLSPAEAGELARRLLCERLGGEADPQLAQDIAEASQGQPSLIEDLVGARDDAQQEGAEAPGESAVSVRDALALRLRRMPAPARRLLEVVAAAGGPIARATAARAAELGAEEPQLLAQLRGRRLLRLRSRGDREELLPYDNRVGEAVLRLLAADEAAWRAAHRRLAGALEETGGDAEALALHYQAAGAPEAAALHAERAAAQAEGALAFERAARLYRMALAAPASAEQAQRLRLRLAEALQRAGRGPEAARAYLAVAPQTHMAPELRRRAAEQYLQSGHLREGLGVLQALLAELGLRMPRSVIGLIAPLLLWRLWLWLRGLRFRERAAAPPRELLRVDTCWSAASGLANLDTLRGAYFETLHLRLALRTGEPQRLLRALALEMSYAALRGGPRPGLMERRAHAGLLQLAGRTAEPYAQGVVALHGGVALVLRGRWQEALQEVDRASEIFRQKTSGTAWEQDSARHFSLLCLAVIGRLRELRRRLPGALADARQRGDLYAEVTMRTRVGHLLPLMEDRPEEAEREVRGALGAWSQEGYHVQHYFAMVSLGETALYAEFGAGGAALGVVRAHWPRLREAHLLRAQSIRGDAESLRGRALLGAAADPTLGGEARRGLLRQAARVARALRREGMTWISAKADLLQAGVTAMEGRRDRAVALLERAAAGFAGNHMELYLHAARFRLGTLLGGAEGQALAAAALEGLRAEDVHAPERLVAMLAPGRWGGGV